MLCVVVIGAVALCEGAVSCSLIVCRWLCSDRAELPGLGCSATEARRDLLPCKFDACEWRPRPYVRKGSAF